MSDDAKAKADLLRYLQETRDSLVWKLDGLSEYDVRRPLTPTGTNLLGLVKHSAAVELGYFGDTFGRPYFTEEEQPAWYRADAEPNADMWATADESREEIVGLYRSAWAHSAATFEALPLDTVGRVPWWPKERRETTLRHLAVRVIADAGRHAGHADILREGLDGAVGWVPGNEAVPSQDRTWWENYRNQLEAVAKEAASKEAASKEE